MRHKVEPVARLDTSPEPAMYEIGDTLPPCIGIGVSGAQHQIVLPDFRGKGEDYVVGRCRTCGAEKKYPKNPDVRLIKGRKKPTPQPNGESSSSSS